MKNNPQLKKRKPNLFNLFMQSFYFIILFIDKVEQGEVLVLCLDESLYKQVQVLLARHFLDPLERRLVRLHRVFLTLLLTLCFLGLCSKRLIFFTNNLFISKSLNTHWHYRKLSSSWSKDVLTFLLSPGNKLWIIHSLLTFDSHKLSQISVMIDDSEQFLHLCIVLLLVFVCSLFQKYHLGLSFIPDFKNSQSCK